MKDQLNLRVLARIEEKGKIVALQISPQIESLHGLGRQAYRFLRNFATFVRLSFGQFGKLSNSVHNQINIRNSSQSSHVFAMAYRAVPV